jgi:hypothetical protein
MGATAVRIMLYMAVARAAGGGVLGFAPVPLQTLDANLFRCAMALASGCSEFDSTAAEYATNSSSDVPGAATTSDTAGEPRVRVPVLSKMTISKARARSSASLSLTRSPF